MVVYIDVLLLINFYVTYFLILATMLFLHQYARPMRKILGALAGSATSFTILLPPIDLFLSLLLKIFICVIIVLIVFGFKNKKCFLKNIFFFLIMNFVFAGSMLALWLFSCPANMLYNNGIVYFDISLLVIIISTTAAYFIVKAIRFWLDRNNDIDIKYTITIVDKGKTLNLEGICDTGNSLTDFFTGKPVIICGKNKAIEIIPESLLLYLYSKKGQDLENLEGIKILPCKTINGAGFVYAFRVEKITISSKNQEKAVDALIGISADDYITGGIFNPKILL